MPEKSSFLSRLMKEPAVQGLVSNAGSFAAAKAQRSVGDLTSRVLGGGRKGGAAGGAVEEVLKAQGEGKKAGAWTAIKGAVKGFFGRGGGAKRPTNIFEHIFIGVPVEVAYREWRRYTEFPKFMKGPESVGEQDDQGKTKWTAKIFVNRRSWVATVVEDIENYKIRWESEAPKGTVNGTVTFNPLGDNLTLMAYALEYRPKGFFEWWGNRWRTVGRRARLDAKHFGRYVMNQPYDQDEDDDNDNADAGSEDQGESTSVQPEDAQGAEQPEQSEETGDDEPESEPEPESERRERRRRDRDESESPESES
jgi:uncharacterized membrane protein